MDETQLSIIQDRIHSIRGQAVILDSDLADLYGVTTTSLNQAVSRNLARFPEDFSFVLNNQDLENLRSQIVTSSDSAKGVLPYQHGATPHENRPTRRQRAEGPYHFARTLMERAFSPLLRGSSCHGALPHAGIIRAVGP